MKRTLVFLAVALAISLYSCNQASPQLKPAVKEMMNEKMTLCQVVHHDPGVVDVFGDSVLSDKYYVYTRRYELVPVAYKGVLATSKDDIKVFLSSLESSGNLQSDTMNTTLAIGGPKMTLRIYAIKGLDVAKISLM